MRRFIKVLKECLRAEDEIMFEYAPKSKVRPSLVAVTLVALFYLLSPIDIIPELVTKPKAIGFVDDILMLGFNVFYVLATIRKEESKDEPKKYRETKRKSKSTTESGGDEARGGNKPTIKRKRTEATIDTPIDTSVNMDNGSNDIPLRDGTTISTHNIAGIPASNVGKVNTESSDTATVTYSEDSRKPWDV